MCFERLALFDLDHTLLTSDSDYEWARFLVDKGVIDREAHEARNEIFFEHYRAGTLDIREFLNFQLKPLASHSRAQLDAWHAEFMHEKILPVIAKGAWDLLEKHADDLRVIITATNDFVTAPIARYFGIEHLIATEAEQVDGEFTGRVVGTPSFREGKVARLEQWLKKRGCSWDSVAESWFYSDSLNDLPLLSRVHRPIAVDPDDTLKRHAETAGWQIISLR
ncbi:MAG: HAD-IB family hydrolase [Sideroxydans sp.]|nr:HAD-IB family hydrolase [Sideroxydans sp.]